MKAAASDIQTAIRLFQEVDADNSGVLCVWLVSAIDYEFCFIVLVRGVESLCCV